MRWPRGPPHLALNPPFFVFFCSIPFFVFNRKKPVFPLKIPLFLFSLFWPLFNVLFLCLCFVLVFLPFFLSFLFALFWFLCFCLFVYFCLSSLLLFHEKNINIFNYNFFFINPFFVGFPVWVPFESLLFIFVFFQILIGVFCSTSMFLLSKREVENHEFLVKRVVATKVFLFEPVFSFQNVDFFGGGTFLVANFGWCSKNYIHGYFSTV